MRNVFPTLTADESRDSDGEADEGNYSMSRDERVARKTSKSFLE